MTTEMTVSQVLEASKAVIEKPEHWTTRYLARDSYGVNTQPFSKGATCWCSIGAIDKVYDEYGVSGDLRQQAIRALEVALDEAGEDDCVAEFNDTRTHAEVMMLWNKAIAKAKEKENENK